MTTLGNRNRMYRNWWRKNREKYGPVIFIAVASIPVSVRDDDNPRADSVDHLFSASFEPGKRHYAFATEEQRNSFVEQWTSAEACDDPVN